MFLDDDRDFSSSSDAVRRADDELFNDGSTVADSEYQSTNEYGQQDPDYQAYRQSEQQQERKRSLLEEAKRQARRGRATVQNTVPKKLGEALGDKHMFRDDTDEARERAKEIARKKARKAASDFIGDKVADKGLKTGMRKALSKEAGATAKAGAKKAAQSVAKGAAKTGAETAAKEGVKAGAKLAADNIGTAVGAATGVETFGFGFLLGLLINIAVSLGVNDVVDAAFELSSGNFKRARFLYIRGGTRVGIFVIFLLVIIGMLTIGGMIAAIPALFALNIYMILGKIYPNFAPLQGIVWWEAAIIIIIDIFAILIAFAFIMSLGWYLCNGVGTTAVAVYNWWSPSAAGSVAAQFCKFVNTVAGTIKP